MSSAAAPQAEAKDLRSRSSLEREYRAIRGAAGYRILDDRLIVKVSGDDRTPFLHGMCTADIKALPPGAIAPALFLTEHAHLIADCFVYALDDSLLLELERMMWPRLRAHVEKFLVADDVEMQEQESSAIIDVEGPGSATIVQGVLQLETPAVAWTFNATGGVANLPRLGLPALTIVADRDAVADLRAALSDRGAVEVSESTIDTVRIEQGLARVGVDTTDKTLALEAQMERAISFNKGCYIGQETIERATARGGIKRRLCGLRLGDTIPVVGDEILLDGKPVGRLSSVAESPDLGAIGLAILHHSAWGEGTEVTVRASSGDRRARVVALPFVASTATSSS